MTETIDSLLARFTALHPRVIDLSLGRIETLLDKLGRPQDRLPPVLHVAGTNGKGSVLAFCRAAYEAAGLSVHQYVSPHLVRFNERIVLNGADIGDGALVALLQQVDAANDGAPITFFEITTAAAFQAFARHAADILLLETGLGGRLDATNVIAQPAATAIVSIDLDHQGYLGDTLEAIAAEKAGILRVGVPCVVGAMPAVARAVIEEKADAVGAPLLIQDRDWTVSRRGNSGLVFDGPTRSIHLPLPALPGAHQIGNAGVAIALADAASNGSAAGIAPLTSDHWQTAMTAVRWPGRLQRIDRGGLLTRLRGDQQIWVDGAHNPAAARALAAWIRQQDSPVHAILGLLKTKDPDDVLQALAPACASVTAVDIASHQSFPADRLAQKAKERGAPATDTAASLGAALSQSAARAGERDILLICGSLYLVGEALAA